MEERIAHHDPLVLYIQPRVARIRSKCPASTCGACDTGNCWLVEVVAVKKKKEKEKEKEKD